MSVTSIPPVARPTLNACCQTSKHKGVEAGGHMITCTQIGGRRPLQAASPSVAIHQPLCLDDDSVPETRLVTRH
jgi:hypothetical protein